MQGIKATIRDNKWLSWLLVVSNWLFQGILHSDKTEKLYRVSFTLIFWISFSLIFFYSTDLATPAIIVIGFFIGHTLNWIVNGNFYSLIIHRLKLTSLSKNNLFDYLNRFEKKIQKETWVLYAASFGSICRGALKDSSDIDISIVRRPGLKNAIKSLIFSVKEKKYADIKGIPLEIYISDTPENSISRFLAENNPVVLFDPENSISKYYKDKLSLSEAMKLNTGK